MKQQRGLGDAVTAASMLNAKRYDLSGIETIEQAAVRTGLSSTTIWRRVLRGELTSERVLGRTVVFTDEVDRLRPKRRK